MAIHRVVQIPDDVDYKNQGFQVPGTKRPGQTGTSPLRLVTILKIFEKSSFSSLSERCVNSPVPAHLVVFHIPIVATFGYVDLNTPDTLTTLTEVFDSGYALSKDNTFLGHRPVISRNPLIYARHYVWQTYAQVDERRRHIGSAIHHLFENGTVGGGESPTVGLWSSNRPGKLLTLLVWFSLSLNISFQLEWLLVELALNAYGKVGVSLYDTLGDEAVGAFASLKCPFSYVTNYDISQSICKIYCYGEIMKDLMAVQHRPCSPHPNLHHLPSPGHTAQGSAPSPSPEAYCDYR